MTRALLAVLIVVTVTQTGCVTPASQYDRRANELGFRQRTLEGDGFAHTVFERTGEKDNASVTNGALHIYLEGDGTPWLASVPSADPTPRSALVRQLAQADPADVVILGRPCYHRQRSSRCVSDLWTQARYSQSVVRSMVAAAQALARAKGDPPIVLIGHSGGGALAQLMASDLDNVSAIITIGANLDIHRWTEVKGFQPLSESRNPVDSPILPASILQAHLIGANDTVVPEGSRRAFFARHVDAREYVIQGFGHQCCWRNEWSDLLTRLLNGQRPGGVTALPSPPESAGEPLAEDRDALRGTRSP